MESFQSSIFDEESKRGREGEIQSISFIKIQVYSH